MKKLTIILALSTLAWSQALQDPLQSARFFTAIPSSDSITAAGAFATTLSIPSTNLVVGSLIEVRAAGKYTTTATSSPGVTLEVNAGGTNGACPAPISSNLPVNTTNAAWQLVCYIQIDTTGAPGTAFGYGHYEFANNASGAQVIGNNKLFPSNVTFAYTTTVPESISLQETAALVSGESFTLLYLSARVLYQ